MAKKICTQCKVPKQLSEFPLRKDTACGYGSWCKECHSEFHKGYYKKHKKRYRENLQKRRKHIRELVASFKIKCEFCPEDHPACLEFHHRDPAEKEDTIAEAIQSKWGDSRIIAEIKKCIVLCSNCHRKLHYDQQ